MADFVVFAEAEAAAAAAEVETRRRRAWEEEEGAAVEEVEEQAATAGEVARRAFQRGYNVAARVHVHLFGNLIGT